jgi:hypothetical protein
MSHEKTFDRPKRGERVRRRRKKNVEKRTKTQRD